MVIDAFGGMAADIAESIAAAAQQIRLRKRHSFLSHYAEMLEPWYSDV